MIAAPRVFRGQDPYVRGEMDETVAALWGQVDIGDATIEEMSRIDGEMRRAIVWAQRPMSPKSRPPASACRVLTSRATTAIAFLRRFVLAMLAPGPRGQVKPIGAGGRSDPVRETTAANTVATVRGPGTSRRAAGGILRHGPRSGIGRPADRERRDPRRQTGIAARLARRLGSRSDTLSIRDMPIFA